MFKRTTDEEVFKRFWNNDATATPQHFQDATHSWNTDWEDFLGFCEQCERVYLIDDSALVYVENVNGNANVHLSVMRGHTIQIEDCRAIRDALLRDYRMIFGWCGQKNRGLRKILEACGLRYYGFEMIHGWSHGKPLIWQCYSLTKTLSVTA